MPKLAFLDPTKTGRAAEDLENQLHHLVVGQEDAIHQIVRAYLRRIFDIELEMVRRRIQIAAASKPFLVNVTDSAREFLLVEGTDFRYGRGS
jgi:ATP-dependent Clp protease ATP-binding subunit ClpA